MTDQPEGKAIVLANLLWEAVSPDAIGGDTAQFVRMMDDAKGESDRGLVLICTSYLDELLRRLISAMLIDEQAAKPLLEGFGAPLGSFGARIKAAFALGIIDQQEMGELERLRKIRNKFAHQFDISLEDQTVRDLCRAAGHLDWTEEQLAGPTRSLFSFAAIAYAVILGTRLGHLAQHKCHTIDWGYEAMVSK